MKTEYIKGSHYSVNEKVRGLDFKASHWEDEEGDLSLLLKIGISGYFSGSSSEMSIWPNAEELRRLSAMFAAAADDLDAHAAFIKARDEAKTGEAA